MITPSYVPKLNFYLHNLYQYNDSDGIDTYKKKLNEGINVFCLPTSYLSKDERKELKQASTNARVNVFNTAGFQHDFSLFKATECIDSESFYFRFSDLLEAKVGYGQIKKRMLKSPCLSFQISSFEFNSRVKRKRAKDILKYINKVDYKRILVEGMVSETTKMNKYRKFFTSIKIHELKLSFVLLNELIRPFKNYKQLYHPAIIFCLQKIEISFEISIFNNKPFFLFPFNQFSGIFVLHIQRPCNSKSINIIEFLILLAFREQNTEIKNWNKHVNLSHDKYSSECLTKLMFSARNMSGRFEKTWFGLLDGNVKSQQSTRFYLKQIETETKFYLNL